MIRIACLAAVLLFLYPGILAEEGSGSAEGGGDGSYAVPLGNGNEFESQNGFFQVPIGWVAPSSELVCGPQDNCYCQAWLAWEGGANEKQALSAVKWIVFSVCVASLLFFGYETWKATCGWEEVYVCIIELVHVCLSIWHDSNSPARLYLSTGNIAVWLRYAEWLLTCPVILIHLSNLTGMKDDYNKRTMALLVSDVGCIVWGTTSALATDFVKIIFFFLGLLYGAYTFYAAAKIYIEAYHTVPKGICRQLVRCQAYTFFFTWSCFPILFMLGPEGFNKITQYSSGIAHEVLDLLSKNLWGLLGHFIRVKIHQHILIHGNITKKTKMNVGGEIIEVETYVDGEEAATASEGEVVIDKGTRDLANRQSFVVMRDQLRAKGVDVRASLGDEPQDGPEKGGGVDLEPGRVILVVPDMSLVDFFKEQFSLMPAPIEVVPALGTEVGLQLIQQALSIGGPGYVDYVLIHPEFLRDRSPSGFLARVKMSGMRACAFGYAPGGGQAYGLGTHSGLIDACGSMLDGFVEGPSFQGGFNAQQLVQLTQRMQTAKKLASGSMGMMGGMGAGSGMGMMGMGMMGSMNNGMMNSAMNGTMNGSVMNGSATNVAPTAGVNGSMMGMGQNGMTNSMMGMNNSMMGGNNLSARASFGGMPATNPLFGQPPSPLGSQLNGAGMPAMPPAATAAAAPAAAQNETEMLSQLMGEINRLKAELGEN